MLNPSPSALLYYSSCPALYTLSSDNGRLMITLLHGATQPSYKCLAKSIRVSSMASPASSSREGAAPSKGYQLTWLRNRRPIDGVAVVQWVVGAYPHVSVWLNIHTENTTIRVNAKCFARRMTFGCYFQRISHLPVVHSAMEIDYFHCQGIRGMQGEVGVTAIGSCRKPSSKLCKGTSDRTYIRMSVLWWNAKYIFDFFFPMSHIHRTVALKLCKHSQGLFHH